jgi:glycosyltransferase involved in cell wall biosynthesis
MNPIVSVIVPNYNHARYLRKRIDSILGQTYQNFELILLDDCSNDNSRDILNSYALDPRVTIAFSETNSGTPFRQWNKGVQLARGRYIWIAESDDYADPRLLARLVSVLETQPEVALAYCRSWRALDDDTTDGYYDLYLEGVDRTRWTADFTVDGIKECRDSFLLYNIVPNASAVVFRKCAFESVGGADETLRICGDYKLWMGMALHGKIAFVAEPLNFFRHHDFNVHRTSRGLRPLIEHFYVVQWLLARIPKDKPLQRPSPNWDELPAVTDSFEQFRACRTLASDLESSIHQLNPSRRHEIARAFWAYQLAIDDLEFKIYPPDRWRFFLSRCGLYRYRFPLGDWKRRLLDIAHLVEAFVGGYENRNWLGKKYAPVRRLLRTFAHKQPLVSKNS